MKLFRSIVLIGLAFGLAACEGAEFASRNQPLDVPGLVAGTTVVARSYTVQQINVVVPEDLTVSEANGYYPAADIVWRGDPIGDRYQQVAAILETAALQGTADLSGDIPVVLDIVLARWHGVTERTRYSIGGNYTIHFMLTVRNAGTGAIIEGPRMIEAELAAPGGLAAVRLEQSGQTEKLRVTEYLTYVFQREFYGAGAALSAAGGV